MRTIKFRGKRLDNGEWIEGAYLKTMHFTYIVSIDFLPANSIRTDNFFEVDPATIGQFTGLTDKNGKEIYEGDVVDMSESWTQRGAEVCFDRGGFCFRFSANDNYYPDGKYLEKGAVIGNIHDNPELTE